jgi:hypothetical protein
MERMKTYVNSNDIYSDKVVDIIQNQYRYSVGDQIWDSAK